MQGPGQDPIHPEPLAGDEENGENEQKEAEPVTGGFIVVGPGAGDSPDQFPEGAGEEKKDPVPQGFLGPLGAPGLSRRRSRPALAGFGGGP